MDVVRAQDERSLNPMFDFYGYGREIIMRTEISIAQPPSCRFTILLKARLSLLASGFAPGDGSFITRGAEGTIRLVTSRLL